MRGWTYFLTESEREPFEHIYEREREKTVVKYLKKGSLELRVSMRV